MHFPPSSLDFSSQLTSLPSLDPMVSPQFAAPPSSLPPPSVAPKVPRSSPAASFASTSSSRSVGPCVSVGSHPGTSHTSDYSPDDVLRYADDNVHSSKGESDSAFRQGCVL